MIANFVLAGQSNTDQWFHAGDGVALVAFKETFLALNPEYTDVQFFDAARGGSAMLSGSAAQYADVRAPDDPDLHDRISQNYWYDEASGTDGPNLTLFGDRLAAEVASGTEFLGIIWAQGEADTTYVGANGAQDYSAGLEYVLDQLAQAANTSEVYIQALGDRAFYSETLHSGSSAIRDAQQAVADGSDNITLATTIFDLELRDSVHLTDPGYETAAHRMAIAISAGETSPNIGQAILLDPNTILLQIDLAPSQGISGTFDLGGFSLSENGSDVAISSASVTSSGLLRIETLTPLSIPTISYGAVEDSVNMQVSDFLYATGPNGTVPILPFDLTVSQPHHATAEITGGLRIEGGALSERLVGMSGNDELIGNAGHDILIGGWGSDDLYGGDGSDVFVFSDDASTDTVHDFNLAKDAIGLMGFSQAAVSFRLSGANDLEIQTADGQSMVLKNVALGSADSIKFHMLGTEGSNDLTGAVTADRIYAYAGDDTISGGAGNDRIWTGTGADTIEFGTGFGTDIIYDFDITKDTISLVDLATSALTFKQYKGTDVELRTPDGDRLILRDVALADSELINIVDVAPTVGFLAGTEESDVLRGTDANELFESLGGTDRLYGGGGSDVFTFKMGSGLNVIYDFEDGQDRILIDAFEFETLSIIPYKSSDAEIRLDSGDRLVLRNIDHTAIDVDDFVFSVPEEFF